MATTAALDARMADLTATADKYGWTVTRMGRMLLCERDGDHIGIDVSASTGTVTTATRERAGSGGYRTALTRCERDDVTGKPVPKLDTVRGWLAERR
ncbi:hypothetical protein SEA_MASELOP_91 [Rhodococcus phage Maselop]|nr:hypothetical protein SEA_MASELOP_91 [Rhodococcus phage Maselop]WNM67474.1 hypothetical protein SEA_POLYYUKI_90 [Rhodococcus phage Polyyuki]